MIGKYVRVALLCLASAGLSGCGVGFTIRHHYLHQRVEPHSHLVEPDEPAPESDPRKP